MLWLAHAAKIGRKKAEILLDYFKTAENVFSANRYEISGIIGLSAKDRPALLAGEAEKEAALDELKGLMARLGIGFISRGEAGFPELLRGIPDCPLGLFYRGSLPENGGAGALSVSIIGSRDCTDYGYNAAYRLSRDLAERGVTIVSGIARGIDGMAHRGALDGRGYTIAVAGTGLDVWYPKEHAGLFAEIPRAGGCVVSEYPPQTQYLKSNFPQRNRLISGLSDGLIVVEAALRSGTSITIDRAIDQGRTIFAVPGNIYSEVSSGTNRLIKDGAVMVTGYEDVLYEFYFNSVYDKKLINKDLLMPDKENNDRKPHTIDCDNKNMAAGESFDNEGPANPESADISVLSEAERAVYEKIGPGPAAADELMEKTGLPAHELLRALTMLEIYGFIKARPGGRYEKSN